MFILVVTGGLGAGKTTATEYFASRGAVVFDLDTVAHRLLDPGTPTYTRIIEEFGDEVLAASGYIDRTKLAELAFADRESAHKLNRITHQAVFRELGPGLTQMGLLPNPPATVVLEVPMLVEAPEFLEFADLTLAVIAPAEQRVQRAVAAGMSEQDARARVACQATDEDRVRIADHVVVNALDKATFLADLERFWDEVVGR